MKQVFSIIAAYLFFCLGVCMAWAFCSGAALPVLLPNAVFPYKVYTGLEVFCSMLPASLEAAFCVSLAISFGKGEQERSRERFSADMFNRYKEVVALCLICVALLTAATELGKPLAQTYKEDLVRQERLARDYEKNGGTMFRAGKYDLAYQYAKLALDIDGASEVAKRIMNDASIARKTHSGAEKEKAKDASKRTTSEEGYTIKELRSLAQKAYKEEQWFDAHYYAQTAVDMAEITDTSLSSLKTIAAQSWNKIETPGGKAQTEEERLYAQKLAGYGALMSGDNLKAYYIFVSLSAISHKMESDPDVVRYKAIAQERLEKAYFFIDETIGKNDFETAHDVHFSLKHTDGTTDVIHIKGIVSIKGTSEAVQYLRGFSMLTIDQFGNMKRDLYDENVKLIEVSTQDLGGMENIPSKTSTVPYLLLRSVDRYDKTFMNSAQCTFAKAGESAPNTLVLSMPYSDFELLKEASKGAGRMDIAALIKIIRRADKYGFSSEVFAQIMLDRLLYPMLILCTLMLLASFAWNFRTKQDIPFQTAWVLSLPILNLMAVILMHMVLYLYRVMNHVFVGVSSLSIAPFFGLGIYIVIFAISSVIFLARNDIE